MCFPGIHECTRDDETEKQQEKFQVCENNLVRRSWELRGDKRRMDELRVEVGVNGKLKKKLGNSRLMCAGHVKRMGDE